MAKVKVYIKTVFNFIGNILFPPRCVFCDCVLEPDSGMHICGKCGDTIEFCSDSLCCTKCGKPIVSFGKRQLCYFCMENRTKYFDRITSVFLYDGVVREAVLRFKASGLKSTAVTFAECIASKIFDEFSDIKFDFICGVMPHNKRQFRKTGVEQIDLLCKILSARLDVPYIENLFKRIRKTQKQSSLGWHERRENMKESIQVINDNDFSGKTLLLIDDVCTTRSTIIEYARALKNAGAKCVYAATIATVQNPK